MQKHNFHTHTIYSDGHDSIRDMIEAAINNGFTSLGFSDHSYTYYQKLICVPYEFEDAYIARIKSEAAGYADKIKVYAGIELDSESEIPHSDFDYILASVHDMIKNGVTLPIDTAPKFEQQIIDEFYGGNSVDFAKAYFENFVTHVKRNRVDIVGHIDVITKYGLVDDQSDIYRDAAIEAVREISKYCKTFELNTGAIARGLKTLPYPADFILRELKDLGCRIIVTSDCHFREKLTTWFNEAEDYLTGLGFTKYENESLNDRIHGLEMWK